MALGSLFGATRIIMGAHFLSDVVFAFFIVYFAAWLLHRLLYPAPSRSAAASS